MRGFFMMLSVPILLLNFIAFALTNVIKSDTVKWLTMDEIYQAALKEKGPLRVVWGGDTKLSQEAITTAFNKAYPGIVLEIEFGLSKYLDSTIDRTYQATDGGDNGADVAVLQTLHNFTRWRDEKRLMPYKVVSFDDIYPQFVDPHGAYTGCFIYTFGPIIYNPNFTDNSTLPTTYADFLKPEWVDRLILTYPNDDDAVLYFFVFIAKKYGFEFIAALIKTQNARWVRGSAAPALIIEQTTTNSTQNVRSVSFTTYNSFAPAVAASVPEDTYMAWPQTGAIFATTTVPESAKLFMNFLLDDAWQATVSARTFSVRRAYDGAGPAGVCVFTQKHVDPLGFGKFMADRAEVERWRLQFESILGPPRGPDPAVVW